MSKFQERIESKIRINGLERALILSIEKFSDENPDLRSSEVNAVMLKMLSQSNEKELREEL